MIVGAAVGGLAFMALIVALIVSVKRKRRGPSRKPSSEMYNNPAFRPSVSTENQSYEPASSYGPDNAPERPSVYANESYDPMVGWFAKPVIPQAKRAWDAQLYDVSASGTKSWDAVNYEVGPNAQAPVEYEVPVEPNSRASDTPDYVYAVPNAAGLRQETGA